LPATVDVSQQQDTDNDDNNDDVVVVVVVVGNELVVAPVSVPTTGDDDELSYLCRRNTCTASLPTTTSLSSINKHGTTSPRYV